MLKVGLLFCLNNFLFDLPLLQSTSLYLTATTIGIRLSNDLFAKFSKYRNKGAVYLGLGPVGPERPRVLFIVFERYLRSCVSKGINHKLFNTSDIAVFVEV